MSTVKGACAPRRGFPPSINWRQIEHQYGEYAGAEHVHNRWQHRLKPATIKGVLGTAKRCVEWAWRMTDMEVSGIHILLRCEVVYGRTRKLQQQGCSQKYLADEV